MLTSTTHWANHGPGARWATRRQVALAADLDAGPVASDVERLAPKLHTLGELE